ncbi:hypothetical protein ABBQ32_001500 [Trebouxia sp. C0010 RCD-2024]
MLASTRASCWNISFWDQPCIQCGNTKVYLNDALAPPVHSLKPKKSTQGQRVALHAGLKESSCGLDYLIQQEKRGKDCEMTPRRQASSKKMDVLKCSVMVVSLMLAPRAVGMVLKPKVSDGWQPTRMDQKTLRLRGPYYTRILREPHIVP